MTEETIKKYQDLLTYLRGLKKVAIAFSGGVDSTFLIYAAKEALAENAVAFTVSTPYIPDWEIKDAVNLVEQLGIDHKIIESTIPESIQNNPEDRCYLCKSQIFSLLRKEAKKRDIHYLLEGTNKDDEGTHRPGMKALKELNVVSPLRVAGLKKEEIRQLSRKFNLPTWNKAANACLLTRIPYNTGISKEELTRIEKGELFLFMLGFEGARLRSHGDLARIELQKNQFELIEDADIRSRISEKLRSFGYKFVCIDLEGYRMGSYDAPTG
jgi:uncharacterized protein